MQQVSPELPVTGARPAAMGKAGSGFAFVSLTALLLLLIFQPG